MSGRELAVFVGAYGSGKTETAINYAVQLGKKPETKKVALVDVDIVNPYFRSREEEEALSPFGIRVISTAPDMRQADLPALSPEIFTVFQDHEYQVVFDAGGDPAGARVLGRYHAYFEQESTHHIFMVVNPYRPMTGTVPEIISMVEAIEFRSRLKIHSLVCNSNLKAETTWPVVRRGYETVRECAVSLGLPVSFICVPEWLSQQTEEFEEPLFPLHLYMLPPWEKDEASRR